MSQNIFIGVICVIAVAAFILSCWIDNGMSFWGENKKGVENGEKGGNEENEG